MSKRRRPKRRRRGEQISVHVRLRNVTESALLYLDLLGALLEAVELEAEQGTIPDSLRLHAEAIDDVLVIHEQVLAEARR